MSHDDSEKAGRCAYGGMIIIRIMVHDNQLHLALTPGPAVGRYHPIETTLTTANTSAELLILETLSMTLLS